MFPKPEPGRGWSICTLLLLFILGVYVRHDVVTVADLPPIERPVNAALTDTMSAGALGVPLDQIAD